MEFRRVLFRSQAAVGDDFEGMGHHGPDTTPEGRFPDAALAPMTGQGSAAQAGFGARPASGAELHHSTNGADGNNRLFPYSAAPRPDAPSRRIVEPRLNGGSGGMPAAHAS